MVARGPPEAEFWVRLPVGSHFLQKRGWCVYTPGLFTEEGVMKSTRLIMFKGKFLSLKHPTYQLVDQALPVPPVAALNIALPLLHKSALGAR